MESPIFLKKSLMLADWATVEAEAAKTGAATAKPSARTSIIAITALRVFFIANSSPFINRESAKSLVAVPVAGTVVLLGVVIISTFANAYTRNHSDFCKTKQEDFCDRFLNFS